MRSSIQKPVLIITSTLVITGCVSNNNSAIIHDFSVVTATSKPTNNVFTFQSTLEAKDNVKLAAQVVGRIRSVDVQEGNQVNKGQLLYTLEQMNEKKLKEAQIAKARLDTKNAQRYVYLNEQGAVSKKTRDEYVTKAESSLALKESLKALQDYKIITSPIKGTVTSIDIKQGSITSIGEPIFNIIDNSVLEARVNIPVSLSGIIQMNEPVALLSKQGGRRIGEGRISFISPSINKGTQTFLIKALFMNQRGKLKHHQKVTVEIQGDSQTSLLIPSQSVFRNAGQDFVFKAVGIKEAEQRLGRKINTPKGFTGRITVQTPIEVVTRGNGQSEVISGLQAGDKIVAENPRLLSNGMLIN
jgi:RND family efflux transporter MFP subunit